MRAEIITIGDELLLGQVTNTNTQWISEQLKLINIPVFQSTTISDSVEHIIDTLKQVQDRSELVIITGGLGPTKDDITKQALCNYFDTQLVFSDDVFNNIKRILKNRNIKKVNQNNRNQAMVPADCKLLENESGTAPGMWFEKGKTVFISIPGVPFEMEHLMTEKIIPEIKRLYKPKPAIHKVIMTQGGFEAELSVILKDWEKAATDKGISVAYLPQPGLIRIRLSAYGENHIELQALIDKEVKKLLTIIPEYIYGFDEEMPYENVGRLLKEHKATLATAESCTGGTIASLLTSVPGSSAYFKGSIVAYSNEIKENILNVPSDIIEKHGAVSKEVVEIMAKNVRKKFDTDYAIAVSGIAGPDGGTQEKPVGTTWIAVCSKERYYSDKFLMGEHRLRNIHKSALMALSLIRKLIINKI